MTTQEEVALWKAKASAAERSARQDAAARAKGGTPKVVILQETFTCKGSDNATYFADSVLDDNGVSPMKRAYAWLKTQSEPINLTSASDA